jgi:serine/threonine-protein kinase
MAVVYLARDVKHDREVGLKVLRPELMAVLGAERFLNEISVTAHLQHPHILTLYDSGEAEGLVFYVMPYVEGESLRDKLTREKQLGIDEAIEITKGVASALDYAHRHGVIHRDIKPENILLHDGQPLVADFGIALAVSAAGGSRLTETGLSLGTPQYMSPEQAMGDRTLDARSDVYSLAAVLYEMLAGEPPYTGPTAQAIVAKVITEKPVPVTMHRDTVSPHVAAALHKALARLPADRFAGAAQFSEALLRPGGVPLNLTGAGDLAAPGAPRRDRRIAVLAAALVAATALAVWGWLRPQPPPQVARFALTTPEGQEIVDQYGSSIALSPDGSRLVYVGPGEGGPQLWLRPLDQVRGNPLPGTQRAISPAFSRDGQSIGFMVGSFGAAQVKVVSVSGGPPVTLADSAQGVSWGPDAWLYYTRGSQLWRVRSSGGPAERITTLDTARKELMLLRYPQPLPNGKGVVLTVWHGTLSNAEIAVVDVRSGTRTTLARGTSARYASSGHLVYARADGVLVAVPFDQSRLALTGPETPLLEGILVRPGGAAQFTLSDNGTLLYLPGAAQKRELVWVERDGSERLIESAGRRGFEAVAVSPDGARLAVSFRAEAGTTTDVWIHDLRQGTLSRLTFEGTVNDRPTWTPDGRRVTFMSDRAGRPALYTVPWDGSGPAEPLVASQGLIQEAEWSRDGRVLVYREGPGRTGRDIYFLRPGVDSAPHPFLVTAFDESTPALAPDGRWLAYVSDESGHDEVYVRPFPGGGGRWQISTEGGTEPLWAPNGREIYYRSGADELTAASVGTVPTFSVGARRRLFATTAYVGNPDFRTYHVSPDGRRFLFMKRLSGARELVVVLNWFQELKRRTSGGGA